MAPTSPTDRLETTEKRILSLLDTDPPSGYSRWLAKALKDVSGRTVSFSSKDETGYAMDLLMQKGLWVAL
jgi:hypothetical protein